MAAVHTEPQPHHHRVVPALQPLNTCTGPDIGNLEPQELRSLEPRTPIPEEDEETSSESVEPVTPTGDSHPQFHHHDGAADAVTVGPQQVVDAKHMALLGTSKAQPAPRVQPPTQTPAKGTATPPTPTQPRPGTVKRVQSFLKNKIKRTNSNNVLEPPVQHGNSSVTFTNSFANGSTAASSEAIDSNSVNSIPQPPKTRRFSSFSLSARTSAANSQSNSPPSPSSPSSTITSDKNYDPNNTQFRKKSMSSSGLNRLSTPPRPSIQWAGTFRGSSNNQAKPQPHRRRSASTEMVPQLRKGQKSDSDTSEDATVGLINTFSKAAGLGAGLKARRLSTSLPDEFQVDFCELDKEFKSASKIPLKKGKVIGTGATAAVRLMVRKGGSADELYAVKQFRGKEKDEDEYDYVQKVKSEFCIANSCHHPNIVETVRLCTHNGKWNHVMEYCAQGELYSLVEKKYFKAEDRLCLFKQLLRGVDYLHSHGIAHRDIKLENLLLTDDGFLKITDFGVSEVFCGEHPGLRSARGQCGQKMGEVRLCDPGVCGSLPYIAPEVLRKDCKYDPRPLDVWSCAIVFLTMRFSGSPWQAAKPEYEFYAKFQNGWNEWLKTHPDGQIKYEPDGWPKCGKLFGYLDNPAVKRLMLQMLHPIAEKRITINEALNSTFVKNIDCCALESYEDTSAPVGVDAGAKKGCSLMAKKQIVKKHNHLPPKENKIPKALQHRFDMGHGYS